jgi:hypothetical protein
MAQIAIPKPNEDKLNHLYDDALLDKISKERRKLLSESDSRVLPNY